MVKLGYKTEEIMSHTRITVKEEDILKLLLEFLRSRNLHVTMRTLEKESGVVNCEYTDEILFLRELILDGDWDEVLLFAKPFEGLKGFEGDRFKYVIYKQKFLEMLSFKSHIVGKQMTESIEEVIKTLGCLEKCCPSKEEYSNLCWLLTVPDLNERIEFKNWSLDNSRMNCFDKVVEMLQRVLPMRRNFKRNKALASRDRLLQLIIKGLFYESCVDYCQAVAVGNNDLVGNELIIKNDLITGIPEDYSANLLSWIKSLGTNSFGIPFEQIAVEIALEKHHRPTHVTQSLDVPKTPRKRDIDVETVFRSLVGGGELNNVTHFSEIGTKVKNIHAPNVWEQRSRTMPPIQPHEQPVKLPIPPPRTGTLGEVSDFGGKIHSDIPNSLYPKTSALNPSITGDHELNTSMQQIQGKSAFVKQEEILQRSKESSLLPSQPPVTGRLSYSKAEDGHVTVKDLKEKQRLDVTRRLENYERERKLIEQELHGLNAHQFNAPEEEVKRTSLEARERMETSQEEQIQSEEKSAVSSVSSKQQPVKEYDYYDSLKRPRKGDKHSRSTDSGAISRSNTGDQILNQTPKASKPSTPHITSTPKQAARTPRETPPPQLSPVTRQPGAIASSKDTKSKRAVTKETLSTTTKRTESSKQDIMQKATETIETGKENTPSTVTPSTLEVQQPGGRKGPMINGVRRTLAAAPNLPPQGQSETVEISKEDVAEAKSGDNAPLKPAAETLNTEKTKSTEPLVRNIKGPGPTIRIKDGTKITVTELLKSRDEVKNATSAVSKPAPVDDHTSQVEEPPVPVVTNDEPALVFNPVCKLEDMQAVRAVAFHPKGNIFAVGANSKTLRVCSAMDDDFAECERGGLPTPVVLFKRTKYHRGSIYCVSWNPDGDIIATGSNDKTIKVMKFNTDNCIQEGIETDLTIHNGTVRELAFVPNKKAMLISGGAGDGGIPITDCLTGQTVGSLQGHSGTVMAVYAGEGDIIATGATDNTLRLWDLRSQRCIDVVMVGESSPASVTLSQDGAFLATGQEDGCILLYDIAAGRTLQAFRLHQEDCRSVRFAPDSKYLLTGSYDNSIDLVHIEKSLNTAVPKHYTVGNHKDKVIQCRWHPWQRSFLSSSADRTVMLWREQSSK